jgi:light-regulated signal transduction histidine kinase (bacteriophytochrome)
MNCVAHRQDDVLIVEFEFVEGAHSLDPSELAGNIQILLTRMERATDVLDYARVAASEVQRLSGFDRAMVYRFDRDWNGEIIAEAGAVDEPDLPRRLSYLGLRFPASDIPAQARHLFLTNAVRAIADLESAPVPVVPVIGPLTGRPLDMSHTFLRSASAVHVEYLRNMGVRSSLAVSIVVEEKLWGMIACHHHSPRPVDSLTRSVCEMIARNLALQVALRDAAAARASRAASRELLEDYVELMEESEAPIDAQAFHGARFLDLVDADGMVSRVGGVVSSQGVSVPEASLQAVIAKLRSLATRGVASSENLRALDASAASYASDASGALFIGLNERSGDYLLFLRRELVETVLWAGDPDKTKTVSADASGKLHPRTSFAAWKETVRGQSSPWTERDLENARFLREQLRHIQDAQRLRKLEALEALP